MPHPYRAAATSALALLAALWAAPAEAKLKVVVVEWGEIEVGDSAGPLGPEYQEHSLSRGHEVTSSRYVNHADHVPAQLCRNFGFQAWFAPGPGDAVPDRILLRVSHPLLTRPDGLSGSEDTLMLPVIDGTTGTSFGFDDPWEVKSGTWTFDLILGGEVLASKTFVVEPPAPGTPAPVCPGRAVS